jgi:hypothetical protein
MDSMMIMVDRVSVWENLAINTWRRFVRTRVQYVQHHVVSMVGGYEL